MIPDIQLPFDGGYLKALRPSDVYRGYVDGLNDPEVNQYLEVRHSLQTDSTVADFVLENNSSNNSLLFGIWLNGSPLHCGTLRFHGMEHIYHTSHIGICLFDKKVWGKGLGTKAIKAASQWALNEFNLRWIEAGAYQQNIGSQKAFLAARYQWVYDIPGKYLFEGKPTSIRVYALRNDAFFPCVDM